MDIKTNTTKYGRLTVPTKVITGPDTRFSYLNAWEPKAVDGGKPKYSVSLIIPKDDTVTINKIKAAIQAAYEEGEGKLKGTGKTVPPLAAIKNPLRDGDIEKPDDEAYANAYFINANSATAPGVVDADRQPIIERSEVYRNSYNHYREHPCKLYAYHSITGAWCRTVLQEEWCQGQRDEQVRQI